MRNPTLTALVLALSASLVWNLHQLRAIHASDALLRQSEQTIQKLKSDLSRTESELADEKKRNTQATTAEEASIADLRNRLSSQRELADSTTQKALDARANLRQGDDLPTLRENLRLEKLYIQELEANLNSVRQRESEAGSQGKVRLDQQKWQRAQGVADLDSQIQAQKLQLQQAEAKVNELKGRRDFFGKQELQEAQKSLKEQKAALQILSDQKKGLDLQWNSDRAQTEAESRATRDSLKLNESQIQDLLKQERARYQAMQSALNAKEREERSRSDELHRLEQDSRAQKSKADEIQSSLRKQEEILKRLEKR